MYLNFRRSGQGGYFLPLSGGVDSSSSAALVFSMCRSVSLVYVTPCLNLATSIYVCQCLCLSLLLCGLGSTRLVSLYQCLPVWANVSVSFANCFSPYLS